VRPALNRLFPGDAPELVISIERLGLLRRAARGERSGRQDLNHLTIAGRTADEGDARFVDVRCPSDALGQGRPPAVKPSTELVLEPPLLDVLGWARADDHDP